MKRLAALAALAWSLVLTLLRRVTPGSGRRSGLRRFLENYERDGIYPVPAGVRERVPSFERCILCGLCELPAILAGRSPARAAAATPEDLAVSLSRMLPDLPALRDEVRAIDASAEAEALCPVGVPLQEIARFALEAGEPLYPRPRIATSWER